MCHHCTKKKPEVHKLKKIGLGGDWIPSWAVCLTWFSQECTTANDSCSLSSLYTSAFNVLLRTNKSRYPLAINIFEFPDDDVHLILLKSHFNACLECQGTVLRKLKFKSVHAKSIIFGGKMYTNWDSNSLPHACESFALTTALYVLSSLQWNVALLLRLQPVTERKLNSTWTDVDNLEVGRQWVYGIKCWCQQFQASYRRDRQIKLRDKHKNFLLYIYIDMHWL